MHVYISMYMPLADNQRLTNAHIHTCTCLPRHAAIKKSKFEVPPEWKATRRVRKEKEEVGVGGVSCWRGWFIHMCMAISMYIYTYHKPTP